MKVWLTHDAMATGRIQAADGKETHNGVIEVEEDKGRFTAIRMYATDWYKSYAEALVAVAKQREVKIKGLEQKISKLKALSFKEVK